MKPRCISTCQKKIQIEVGGSQRPISTFVVVLISRIHSVHHLQVEGGGEGADEGQFLIYSRPKATHLGCADDVAKADTVKIFDYGP